MASANVVYTHARELAHAYQGHADGKATSVMMCRQSAASRRSQGFRAVIGI